MITNDRLEIILLNRPSETFLIFIDVQSVLGFLRRSGRIHQFSILAHKGNKSVVFFDKIDPVTLEHDLTNFQNEKLS